MRFSKESQSQRVKKPNKNLSKKTVQAVINAAEQVKGIFKRLTYKTKDEYRQFYLTPDIAQARIVILLLAITIALFAISDYMFFGLSLIFYGLVTLRLGLIIYSASQINYISQLKSYRFYDRSILFYLLVIVAGILVVNITRPQNFLPHLIVIDMAVFVFYLVIPTRFLNQAIPALLFSLGEVLIILLSFQSINTPALFTALFSLFFANVVAAVSSLQLHSYRWRIFQNISKQEETDRLVAIGQTAGMIGHDIRNPLQAITNELYIAKKTLAKLPEKEEHLEALESISIIQEQTDYINKIVSDLQDFARPLKPEYTLTNLAELLNSVFSTIEIPDKIKLAIDIGGNLKLKTDPTFVRRALTNLINNAMQAMPEGGKLELAAFEKENKVVITVSDTGMGIPQEIKPKLFTPLVTTKAKGQGLGLAVVKRLVEALDGSITFESEEGKGTKFIIEFPLLKPR